MSTGRTISQGSSYPSVSWADTLDIQRSALRWDVKRAMKSLCSKLAEIGEECFVVTVNISNGWVGHLGTPRGDEYIDEKAHILYDFLNYCAESFHAEENEEEIEDNSSDTESCKSDTNNAEKDETPIRISRPIEEIDGNVMTTGEEREEENINIDTCTTLQLNQPAMKMIPLETGAEKFILMSPADFKNVTQRVLETEYQPVVKLKPPQEIQTGGIVSFKKDEMTGSKQKREQSFEGKTNRGNMSNVSKQYKEYLTNTSKSLQSKEVTETEGVAESTRVLRSRNSRKQKTESSDDENEEDEDDDDTVDNEDSDFDIDDAKDEDWDVELEEKGLYLTPGRDSKGRFKGRLRSERKQMKVKDSFDSVEKDIDEEKAEDGTSTEESDKFVRVNFIHSIRAGEKGIQVMEGRLESVEDTKDIKYIGTKKIEENKQKLEKSVNKGTTLSKRKKRKIMTVVEEDAIPFVDIKLENVCKVEIGEEPSEG